MTASRARWFGTPHLARAEGGAEALAALRSLPADAQREVLAFGDRLADLSLAVAQAYALRAPHARARHGGGEFTEWAETGLGLAGAPFENRDAATAFFRLDPDVVIGAGRRLRRRWIELSGEVQEVSRRLATACLESSGRSLRRLGTQPEARLEAWVRAGVRLARGAGWRGEFLAAAYFASGEAILPVLEAGEIEAWAALGARVQFGREINQAFFQRLPVGLAQLGARERTLAFSMVERAAAVAPKVAASLFTAAPAALTPLPATVREAWLSGANEAAEDPEGLHRALPLLGAIVRSVPEVERAPLFARAAETAMRHPACFVPLLRSLPRARSETDAAGVIAWIARGEAIAAENPAAGPAYFALESRTAELFLRESSAAVRFEEAQGVLRSYARMLSGAPLTLRAADGASLRAFVDAEILARESIALPERVDLFDSWEDNFSLLKLMTANAVGRLLYGTFDLSIARVAERLPAPLAGVLASAVTGDTLGHLLEVVPEADPLITLFAACEGARIDARLRRAYRGYTAELRRVARRFSRFASRRQAAPELLLFLIGAGETPPGTAELPAEVLQSVADVLLSPAAEPEDALAAAILLRERLGDSLAVSGVGPPSSYEELLFEKMTGETVLEPDPGSDGRDQSPRPTEVLDVEPAAVEEGEEDSRGTPLSAAELRRLLEAGAIVKVGRGEIAEESAGIFATGLSLPPGVDDTEGQGGSTAATATRMRRPTTDAGFDYDEWDHEIGDYRTRWCHLDEMVLGGDAGEFFQQTLQRYADLLPEVRRQFQRIRPERYLKVRGLEDGEDFDLNAVVEARTELRARRAPSPRLYVARRREERDVATLFLLDMSASTDEPVVPPPRPAPDGDDDRWLAPPTVRPRRIIDVTKEALVIMAEALDELGDRYGIYGFSGQGRANVEFYLVKHFNEALTPGVRGRIAGIEPRRSTRMGTALRHAITRMANLPSRSKHILLLSDGFPQDFDYGADRRSNTYGIQDTMMALQECQAAGITPFCITVDKTGHDYLRQMCETSRYLVIEDVASLPIELPKIYERWVQG